MPDPAGIIAFTFTERAADELKARISVRVEERLGPAALDKLGAAFVGTIHSYCFRLLQHHMPRYETFDVLDERRLTAFLCREEPALHLKNLTGKVFTSIKAFLENLEVVENELIPLEQLDDPFRGMAEKFYELLEQFRLLTYGQLISRAVSELEKPEVAAKVHNALQHLIVDEYQDVNPRTGTPRPPADRPAGGTVRGRRRRPGHLQVARLRRPQHGRIHRPPTTRRSGGAAGRTGTKLAPRPAARTAATGTT